MTRATPSDNRNPQRQLFRLPDADLHYWPAYLAADEANRLQQQLAEQLKKKPENLANNTVLKQQPQEEIVVIKPIKESTPQNIEESISPKVAEPQQELQKPTAEKSVVKKSFIPKISNSLIPNLKDPNSIKTEEEKDEEKIELTGTEQNPFTQEEFLEVWTKYSAQMRAANKMKLSALMDNYTPIVKDNFLVELQVESKILVDELIYEKVDLMNHIRTQLKNFKIMLEPIIVEQVQEKKLYTSRDKYQHLVAKNPKLDEFRKVFNLDLD